MKKYLAVRSVFYKISKIIAYISMAAMMFVTILTTVDVILRLVSSATGANVFVQGTYEVTQLFMTLMVFLVYAVTERDDGHVNVTILTAKLPMIPRHILKVIVNGITTVFITLLTYCSWQQAVSYKNGGVTSTVLFIPYLPFAFLMTVGILMLDIIFIFKFINSIITTVKGDEWDPKEGER